MIFGFDVDDTVTAAPSAFSAISHALRAAGHKVVVLTGHGPERERKDLLAKLDFVYDELLIADPKDDGSGKAKVLEKIGCDFMFENSVVFGPAISEVCPVTFMYTEPPGDKQASKDAKKAAKALKRMVLIVDGPHAGVTVQSSGLANRLSIEGCDYFVCGDQAFYVDA